MTAFLATLKTFGSRLLALALPRLGKAAERAVDAGLSKVEKAVDDKIAPK
jgi:hypothetical protein